MKTLKIINERLSWLKSNPEAAWKTWLSILLIWLILEIKNVGDNMPSTPEFPNQIDAYLYQTKESTLDVRIDN